MKIATLASKNSRDGRAVLVSNDLKSCHEIDGMTVQDVLDAGATEAELAPKLLVKEPFDPNRTLSPLPRAFQFLDGSAYVNHVELVRKARGAAMPDSFWTDPLMYQGGSDSFLSPCEDIVGAVDWGIDFEAEVAVITGDVPMGADRETALEAVRFVMLCNDVSLRNLIPAELGKGFGFVQSKPACAFSPVAVSPDGLPGWQDGKLRGVLNVDLNGEPFGRADAGIDMTFDFGALITHAAKTRHLTAGTIIGSGTVSNKLGDGHGKPVASGGAGYSCIAEQRMIEIIESGVVKTPFLGNGDHVKIWMEDAVGHSIFGSISQTVRTICVA